MRRNLGSLSLALLLLPVAAISAPQTTPPTEKQQKVVDYLLANWGKNMNVTGVSLAMQIMGDDYTPNDRYAIGAYLRDHPELHRVLRTFGWETVALDPEEKVMARVLSRAERERQTAPSLDELSRLLGYSPALIRSGLGMLERFAIIRRHPSAGGVGYRMALERYVDWEGAMRITFMNHRVQVEGLRPFDVY